MPRTLLAVAAALPLFAALALPIRSLAGPPEGPSGEMVLDEVADGLRRYRLEKDYDKRCALLTAAAATRDMRVAVVLVREVNAKDRIALQAIILLIDHYLPVDKQTGQPMEIDAWVKAREAELRRRARQLP